MVQPSGRRMQAMPNPTQYKIIPEGDELAAIERELRFWPVTNDAPQVLSRDDIARFNRDGYLAPIRIFDRREIESIRSYFDELLSRVLGEGKDSYSISSAHLLHGRVFDVLTDRRLVAVMRDLLGQNVIAWGSHFFCKLPRDPKSVAWHQDASYWPLTPSKTATAWLAIDDADVENGCMRFIPGSHLHGHIPYRKSAAGEGNVLDQTVDDALKYGREPVDVVLAAGEISIHSDLLLHGSAANHSPRRRCGLTLRYCAAEVRAHLDWNQKGIIVSGTDPAGHWSNRRRPAED